MMRCPSPNVFVFRFDETKKSLFQLWVLLLNYGGNPSVSSSKSIVFLNCLSICVIL